MLILKFIKQDNLDRHVEVSLSCATVEVIHCDEGYIVIAYKTLIHAEGVEYRLSSDNNDPNVYKMCFVINEQGKTVDKYTTVKPDKTATK